MRRYVIPVVIFMVVVGAAAAAEIGGKNKVRADTFNWMIYETPHFQIHYYDRVEPKLEKLASYAESAYDDLARRINYQVDDPIIMIAYANHAEFEQTNVIVGFIPEGVGAFATAVRNRMVLPLDLSDRELQALIQHELTHIFQYEILFRGSRGRIFYSRPPLWFMEGMASYYAADEGARDRAYLRDAALSNTVPSIASNVSGFYAYRYGHMVFKYIEEEWGEDAVTDFVMAFRNAMGGRINRPFRRVFNMDAEEFDAAFHAWLRKKYRAFTDRGMPDEFGRRFRVQPGRRSQELSPVASPSGDLLAAFSTYRNEVDLIVLGVPDRRLYKKLTKGYSNQYDYLVAQGLTVGPDRGRDLAFSGDGNQVAVIARTERTRSVLLFDAHKGGIQRSIEIPLPIERVLQPAFSPDSSTIAFQAYDDGQSDIYLLDLASEQVTNLTNDESYDSAPTFTPDGKAIVYTSQPGEVGKLVKISIANPSQREPVTYGPGNDEGAAFSADGKHLYFASDREDGVLDIYQLDLETQRLIRVTHVIGIAVNPVPVQTLEGERVVYQAFSRGVWDLYVADPNQGEIVSDEEPEQMALDLEPFVPAVSITVDPEKAQKRKKRKFYIEDARTYVGVDQNSNFITDTYISLSDNFGDHRIAGLMRSVQSYTNINLAYMNLEHRLQWGVNVFDQRMYYVWGYDQNFNTFREREQVYRQTGASLVAQYPLSRELRIEGQLGYMDRAIDYPTRGVPGEALDIYIYDDQFPFLSLGVVGDSSRWKAYGPHGGMRWQLSLAYAPDTDDGGAMSQEVSFEARKYFPTTTNSELAVRLFLGYADGTRPTMYTFGGLDTLRGAYIRSINGNRVGYLNVEWRFPLIYWIDSPIFRIQNVRGYIFADFATAWFDFDGDEFYFWGDPVAEGDDPAEELSTYGFGIAFNLMGMPARLEWVKENPLKDTPYWDGKEGTQVEFWVGYQF